MRFSPQLSHGALGVSCVLRARLMDGAAPVERGSRSVMSRRLREEGPCGDSTSPESSPDPAADIAHPWCGGAARTSRSLPKEWETPVSQRVAERVPVARGRRALTVVLVLTVVLQLVVIYDPNPSGVPAFPGLDKIVHATIFALPTLVGLLALSERAWLVPALMVAHAPLSEVVQATLLPERSGDPMDAAADLVGVAAGIVIGSLVRRARRQRVESGDA